MKLTTDRPYSDPEKAARRLMQHACAFRPVQDGRIYIEKINAPFLFADKADYAIPQGWLELHESGTYVKFTQSGADLFT